MAEVHIDVFLKCMGQVYPVGHGDVEHSEDLVTQAGHVASLLHRLAWEYEELAQREESGFKPRILITSSGDKFYEVKADRFVLGMSLADAQETYESLGGASSLIELFTAHGKVRVLFADDDRDFL